MDRTLVILKPNAVQRGLVGEIISRFERKGLKIVELQMKKMTQDEAARLYAVHKGRSFYDNLLNAITAGPVVLMILEGRQAVEVVRKLIGATDPVKAEPGTIRGDYGIDITDNLVHASDSQESYEKESAIFFPSLEKTL